MQDALEQLAELIAMANVNNKSPGSWVAILPSGEATYAGEKFPTVAKMLNAVQAMANKTGEPERVHQSLGGWLPEVLTDCCALPGSTRIECQRESGRATACRCSCHDDTKRVKGIAWKRPSVGPTGE